MSDKPIKHIELSKSEWIDLRARLVEEYGEKIRISWVMRRECGFTVREHIVYKAFDDGPTRVFCLDFYDEQMKTWYILKYT